VIASLSGATRTAAYGIRFLSTGIATLFAGRPVRPGVSRFTPMVVEPIRVVPQCCCLGSRPLEMRWRLLLAGSHRGKPGSQHWRLVSHSWRWNLGPGDWYRDSVEWYRNPRNWFRVARNGDAILATGAANLTIGIVGLAIGIATLGKRYSTPDEWGRGTNEGNSYPGKRDRALGDRFRDAGECEGSSMRLIRTLDNSRLRSVQQIGRSDSTCPQLSRWSVQSAHLIRNRT
jgi:hypothetical protein